MLEKNANEFFGHVHYAHKLLRKTPGWFAPSFVLLRNGSRNMIFFLLSVFFLSLFIMASKSIYFLDVTPYTSEIFSNGTKSVRQLIIKERLSLLCYRRIPHQFQIAIILVEYCSSIVIESCDEEPQRYSRSLPKSCNLWWINHSAEPLHT